MFYLILLILLSLLYYHVFHSNKPIGINRYQDKREHFQTSNTRKDITIKSQPSDIYDKFYANVYDELFDSSMKNEFECMFIHKDFIPKGNLKNNKKNVSNKGVKILDLGCGTGQHLKILSRYGHSLVGLDQSKYMLRIAKEKLSHKKNISYKLGDFHHTKILPKKTFTHILCLFYTIYYTPNLKLFLDNCNYWLKPQGYLFIHTIDVNKFDPVLERSSNLIPNYDPQKHTDTRITQTQLSFDTFDYQADWEFKKVGSPVFEEGFDFPKLPYIRKNKHQFYYQPRKQVVKQAKKCGFHLVKVIDQATIGFKHNYMLCFQKKYGI